MQDQDRLYEDRLQANCYQAFHNQYPHLRGLLCYNLNNSANAIQGNKNKAMGLQDGRCDLVLYYAKKATMIEMKALNGVQRNNQKEWEAKITAQGFDYYIVRTEDEFMELIKRLIC